MTDPLHERLAQELVDSLTPQSHFAAGAMPAHLDVNRADLKDACVALLEKYRAAVLAKTGGRPGPIPRTLEAP